MGEVTVAPASTSIPSQTARKKVTSNIDRLLKLQGLKSGNKRENEGGNIDDALPLPLDFLVLFTHSKPCEKRTYDAGEPVYTYCSQAKFRISLFFWHQKKGKRHIFSGPLIRSVGGWKGRAGEERNLIKKCRPLRKWEEAKEGGKGRQTLFACLDKAPFIFFSAPVRDREQKPFKGNQVYPPFWERA